MNAYNHFESAKLLKSENQTGFALSHMIFAGEEATKAFALLLKSFNTPVDDEILTMLFSKHKVKHRGAKMFNSLYFNFGNILAFTQSILTGKITKTKKEFENDITATMLDAFREQPKSPKLREVYSFWDNAERQRTLGLYVELFDTKWWHPNKTKEENYYKTKKLVEKLLDKVKGMIGFVEEPSSKDSLEKLGKYNEKLRKMKEENEKMMKRLMMSLKSQ